MKQNTYEKYDDLPKYLKDYCERFGWTREELEDWVRQPIPALGNNTILQALSDGQQVQVNNLVARVGEAMGMEEGP